MTGGDPTVETAAPALGRRAFRCMFCGVYASQEWHSLAYAEGRASHRTAVARCACLNCDGESYWLVEPVDAEAEREEGHQIWPFGSSRAEPPHAEMPDDVRADYEEARAIVERSPRGAAALLRLAVQKLCARLAGGKNLNDAIGALVAQGLPVGVQQALDALRVVGNSAVHPGSMDLRDDVETAVGLFALINLIVDQQIAEPRRLAAVYASLPDGARRAIERRDAAAPAPPATPT